MASDATLLIGLDEAGYGPNLGPLVVGASAWRVSGAPPVDLYDLLSDGITCDPSEAPDKLLIADSKSVYKPGGGLAGLERVVLPACESARDWRSLIKQLQADPFGAHDRAPWRTGFNASLPIDADPNDIASSHDALRSCCESEGVAMPQLQARLVFPEEFNELVDQHGTKGAALSHVTLGLLRGLLDQLDWLAGDQGPMIEVTLDKHGGRNRYGALVQHWLPEMPLAILEESRPISRYRVGERLTLTFRSKGEAEAPVALASMTAKYLREVSMKGFNAYWSEQVHGLKPTAGYPVDAKRFKAEIAPKQATLGITDHVLWRCR